jgi:hypothetical protein
MQGNFMSKFKTMKIKMSKHSKQINRIKEKFEQAKTKDSDYQVFGASHHKYQLGRTVTQKEVSVFEENYNVELPECYKAFIIEFSGISILGRNSCNLYTIPSESYGLYSFEQYLYPLDKDTSFDKLSKLLAEKSVIYPDMPQEEWKRIFDILEQNNTWVEIDKKAEEEDEDYYTLTGLLPLGTSGCHYSFALVMTGKYRGRVVYIDDSNYDIPFHKTYSNLLITKFI